MTQSTDKEKVKCLKVALRLQGHEDPCCKTCLWPLGVTHHEDGHKSYCCHPRGEMSGDHVCKLYFKSDRDE